MILAARACRSLKWWLPCLRLMPALSLLITTIILTGCGNTSHPADQIMEQKLRSNRGDFDNLVKMLHEDHDVVRLDQKFIFLTEDSNRSISEERLGEYRRLFGKLGLVSGMHRDKEGAVRLIASTKDTFLTNSEKSYVYSRTPPSRLVESLDRVIKSDRGDQAPVYKEIADNWYLYYESW